MEKGGCGMDSQAFWRFFLETGLPEAYSLYCWLKAEEAAAEATLIHHPLA